MKHSFLKYSLIFVFFLGLVPFLSAKTLVLYHTSDGHGFYYPKNDRGGVAALGAVLKQEKGPYLLLDSGDFASGTIEAKDSKGLSSIKLMNALKYDAAAVGNHEFDYEDSGLNAMLNEADFAVLAANMTEKNSGQSPHGVLPYKIFEKGGIKTAIVGLANRHPGKPTKQYALTEPLAALDQALTEAEKYQPDVVVVLVHDSLIDYKNGVLPYMGEIGTKFSGRVHIVLGGHAHKIFQNEYVGDVLYVESGCYLKNVSKIIIQTDANTGKFLSAKSELIALSVDKVGQDKDIAALAEEIRTPGMDISLGKTTKDLSKKPDAKNHRDTPLDNWMADIGRSYTQTDIFIHNSAGARTYVEAGEVTQRDLVNIFPFDDYLMKVTVDGKFLKKFVEAGLLPWNKYNYSGLSVSYRLNKAGEVTHLRLRVNGEPVQNNKLYTVGMNDYVAARGYLFKQIPAEQKKQVGRKTVRGLMEESLRSGPITPPATGRIVQK